MNKCGVRVRIVSAAKSQIASSAEFHPYHIPSSLLNCSKSRTANEHVQNLIDAGQSLQVCNHLFDNVSIGTLQK